MREDFYWALNAVFVKRRDHQALFDQAFHIFWRKPKMIEQLMQLLFQQIAAPAREKNKDAGYRRLAQALFDDSRSIRSRREQPPGELELEATITYSAEEVLRRKDFEQMTVAEQAEAKRAIARPAVSPASRSGPAASGRRRERSASISGARSDGRCAAAATSFISASDPARRREPPLVVLCDISGSMSGYSRMFLHFLHALMNDGRRMQVFLFGTRLTNVTRELARRDVDEALTKVSDAVKDWSGGTRIGNAIREFNYRWARRVLAQGAHVLLMSDGLDRGDTLELSREMARLARTGAAHHLAEPAPALCRLRGKSPGRAGRSCPMSTNSGRSTVSRALKTWLGRSHIVAGPSTTARRWSGNARAA